MLHIFKMLILSICAFRYEDFFGGKKASQKKKTKHFGGSDDMDMDEPDRDDGNQVVRITSHFHFCPSVLFHIFVLEKIQNCHGDLHVV